MDFWQWFRYFSDRIKCTQVAEIKLSVLLLKQYLVKNWQKITVPNPKNNDVCKAFDHKRYQWYKSEDSPPPPAFGQKLSV